MGPVESSLTVPGDDLRVVYVFDPVRYGLSRVRGDGKLRMRNQAKSWFETVKSWRDDYEDD